MAVFVFRCLEAGVTSLRPAAADPSLLSPGALTVLGLIGVALLLVSGYLALSRGARLRKAEQEMAGTKLELQERCTELANAEQELLNLKDLRRREAVPVLQVAHELRGPCASIQGTLDVLLQGYSMGRTEVYDEMLRLARDRAASMLELCNAFLHLGSIRQAEAETQVAPVQLVDVLWRVLPELRIKATLRSLHLEVDAPDSLPLVGANDEHMAQVLYNLLDNAIKYTDPGGRIAVSLKAEEDSVLGTVEDTGIGIPPDDMSRIFDGFYRAKNAKAVEPYGTGLGLSIVKSVVELYGGRLHVESEVGEGTRFSFRFPRYEANQAG